MTLFFTVCNRSQLAEAVVLGRSVLELHPGARFVIGWADAGTMPLLPGGFEVVPLKDLSLANREAVYGRYYEFELTAAARPWFARELLGANPGLDCLVFCAPTVRWYRPVTEVIGETADFYLTPHITAGLPPSSFLDDKRILNVGMFHSGGWVARPSEAVKAFIDWWADRTTDRAHFDLCKGMCLDQLWLNYAPVHLPGSRIIRHEGWHTGLHNLPAGAPEQQAGGWTRNGVPLISADFAGTHTYHPVWSDHVRLGRTAPSWQRLYADYRAALKESAGFRMSGTPVYGKYVAISPNRLLRNQLAGRLKQLVRFITETEIKL